MADDITWANYQKWSADTVLTLCNVPWNSDYRDIYGFDTQSQLDAWIDSKQTAQVSNFSLAKFNRNVKIDTPLNTAMRYNYLRASNPLMPVPGDVQRNYYYFITGIDYVGPKNTVLTVQLDVWATFQTEVEFGRCLVEQGHIGIANTNQFQQYGRSYLTVPEGLDAGNEYRIVHKERTRVMDSSGVVSSEPGYDVLVCSTLDLTQDPGTEEKPALDTATGGNWNGLPSGADFYVFPTGLDLQKFFTAYTDKPWITQSIISITLIPNMTRYNPSFDYGPNLGGSVFTMYKVTSGFYSAPPLPHAVANFTDWRNADFLTHVLGSAYAGLKKFFTFPYMVIELTAHNGSPVLLRPEAWQDADAKIIEVAAFVPPGQRIAMYPARYNADAETLSSTQTDNLTVHAGTDLIDDNGESFDIAVMMDNFPSLPIVNNMGIAYLAQNAHGIAFSFQNASWGQQRAIAGGQAGADVASAGIGNTARQSAIANQNAAQQAAIGSNARVAAGIASAAGSGLGGNIIGGAGALIGSGMSASAELESTNASIGARGASTVSDVQTAGSVRDTNQQYANFAANGDYNNAVKGILARNQDAQLTQPSVSGQFGGDAFNLVQGLAGYVLTWKMPNLNALRQIGNYWLRYGYAVHQYLTPPATMRCMSKFTYWKMTETYISQAPIPENFKQVIRGIFEKGVTVWTNPDDIATAALTDNTPLTGISY